MSSFFNRFASFILFIFLLILWQIICIFQVIPNYMLPSPSEIFLNLISKIDLFISSSVYTLSETLIGLSIGSILAFLCSYLNDRFSVIKNAFLPLISITQAIPVIAIAPIIILFFGLGILPKIILVALMTFFPIVVSLTGAYANIPKELIDMSNSFCASFTRTFLFVKVPYAANAFFDSLKISVTYAFSSAVIAEWLGGDLGLGVIMTRAKKSFDYTTLFSCVVVIIIITLIMIYLVDLSEKKICKWKGFEKYE